MLETEMLCYVPTYRNVATLSVIYCLGRLGIGRYISKP